MTSVAEDLVAEGPPEVEFHVGIATRLPRKRVAGGALFRDHDGRILVVEPTYKPGLEIPGGIANDNESPRQACIREVGEELGIEPLLGDLLVVDWVPRHGVWPDGEMFIFDGGILSKNLLAHIRLQSDELRCYKYLSLEEIRPRVRPSMARRLESCLCAIELGHCLYLEFGRH